MRLGALTRPCTHCAATLTLYQVTMSKIGYARRTPDPEAVFYVWAVSVEDASKAISPNDEDHVPAPKHPVYVCPAREYRELLEEAAHEH